MPYLSKRGTDIIKGATGLSGWATGLMKLANAGLAFGSSDNKKVAGSSAALSGLSGAGQTITSGIGLMTTFAGADAKDKGWGEKGLNALDNTVGILKGLGSMTSGALGGFKAFGGDDASKKAKKGATVMNFVNGGLNIAGSVTGVLSNLVSSRNQKHRSEDTLIDAARTQNKNVADIQEYENKIAAINRDKTSNPFKKLWRHHKERKAKKELRDKILSSDDPALAGAQKAYKKAKHARIRGRVKAGIGAATGVLGGIGNILGGISGVTDGKVSDITKWASKGLGALSAVGGLAGTAVGSLEAGRGMSQIWNKDQG